jgi:hypothetical protein
MAGIIISFFSDIVGPFLLGFGVVFAIMGVRGDGVGLFSKEGKNEPKNNERK